MSSKPAFVTSFTRAPFRSRRALVATVEPWKERERAGAFMLDAVQHTPQALQDRVGRIGWCGGKLHGAEASSVQEEDVGERPSSIDGYHRGDLSLSRFAHKFLGPFRDACSQSLP